MLDLQYDKLIPITAIPALLAERGFRTRYGRPVALRTVQGWAERGELETTPAKRGGVRHTTIEALERMLSGGNEPKPGARPVKRKRRQTARQQAQASEDAAAACDADGW